jgi:hypothetical protein
VPAILRVKYGEYQTFDLELPYNSEHVMGCLSRKRALSYTIQSARRGFKVLIACEADSVRRIGLRH